MLNFFLHYNCGGYNIGVSKPKKGDYMKKLLIILLLPLLFACTSKPSQVVDPDLIENNQETTYRDEGLRIDFDDSVETTKVIDEIFIEILINRVGDNTIFLEDYTSPQFFFATYDNLFFNNKASLEGTVTYNSDTNKLNIQYIVGVGTSTGALDGDHVSYTFNLNDQSLDDFSIKEWTGKKEDDLSANDISEKEYVDFSMSLYSTLKERYGDWDITDETF